MRKARGATTREPLHAVLLFLPLRMPFYCHKLPTKLQRFMFSAVRLFLRFGVSGGGSVLKWCWLKGRWVCPCCFNFHSHWRAAALCFPMRLPYCSPSHPFGARWSICAGGVIYVYPPKRFQIKPDTLFAPCRRHMATEDSPWFATINWSLSLICQRNWLLLALTPW